MSVWSHGNRQLGMEPWATLVTGRITSSAVLIHARVCVGCCGNGTRKKHPWQVNSGPILSRFLTFRRKTKEGRVHRCAWGSGGSARVLAYR